jgi:hypothetical protein
MRIRDSIWFYHSDNDGQSIIGLVKVAREDGGGFEYYLGTTSGEFHSDGEATDAEHIVNTGCLVSPRQFANFFDLPKTAG